MQILYYSLKKNNSLGLIWVMQILWHVDIDKICIKIALVKGSIQEHAAYCSSLRISREALVSYSAICGSCLSVMTRAAAHLCPHSHECVCLYFSPLYLEMQSQVHRTKLRKWCYILLQKLHLWMLTLPCDCHLPMAWLSISLIRNKDKKHFLHFLFIKNEI